MSLYDAREVIRVAIVQLQSQLWSFSIRITRDNHNGFAINPCISDIARNVIEFRNAPSNVKEDIFTESLCV